MDTKLRRIVNFTPFLLYPKKRHYYPLNRKKNNPHSMSIRFDEEKTKMTPIGIPKPDRTARNLFPTPTAFCRLSTAVNWYYFAFYSIG
jgi:hypothetical protein